MVLCTASGHRLAISGRIDVLNSSDVREALHTALGEGTGDLLVDVSGVDLVDATGLGVLVGAHRRAGQLDRRIVLVAASPRFLRILRMTRLHRVLAVEDAPSGPGPVGPVHSDRASGRPAVPVGPVVLPESRSAAVTHQ